MEHPTVEKITLKIIEQLFLQLAAIYPYRWAAQFESDRAIKVAKSEWYEGLKDLSEIEIRKGLNVCRQSDEEFPPSIGRFRKRCLPTMEELGILSEEDAYQQFLYEDYGNEIVGNTYLKMDMWAFRMASEKEAKKIFIRMYRLCVDKYISSLPNHFRLITNMVEENS